MYVFMPLDLQIFTNIDCSFIVCLFVSACVRACMRECVCAVVVVVLIVLLLFFVFAFHQFTVSVRESVVTAIPSAMNRRNNETDSPSVAPGVGCKLFPSRLALGRQLTSPDSSATATGPRSWQTVSRALLRFSLNTTPSEA